MAGVVVAPAVVSTLVTFLDVAYVKGLLQFLGGLSGESTSLSVIPGEGDGRSAALNGAVQGQVLTLRGVPHMGVYG